MAELPRECGSAADGIIVFRGDPSPAELLALLREAPVVLNGHMTIDAALLAAAPNLRSIVFFGTGASSYVDMAEAARRGIAVRIVRNYGHRTIAEHAFGLLLAAARDFAAMDRDIRSGRWDLREGAELKDKIVGIVRVGAVGAEMVRIASAFVGMRVVAWNRSPIVPDLPCETMALYELLTIADAVSIHLALTPKTHRFFDAAASVVSSAAFSSSTWHAARCPTQRPSLAPARLSYLSCCARRLYHRTAAREPSLRSAAQRRSRRMRPGSRGRRAFGACARA